MNVAYETVQNNCATEHNKYPRKDIPGCYCQWNFLLSFLKPVWLYFQFQTIPANNLTLLMSLAYQENTCRKFSYVLKHVHPVPILANT